MAYKIIEVHQEYKGGELFQIAVLWESNEMGWVRASYCNTEPCYGYKQLMTNEVVSPAMIQQVAGQGMNLPDKLKKKYFPGKKLWEK